MNEEFRNERITKIREPVCKNEKLSTSLFSKPFSTCYPKEYCIRVCFFVFAFIPCCSCLLSFFVFSSRRCCTTCYPGTDIRLPPQHRHYPERGQEKRLPPRTRRLNRLLSPMPWHKMGWPLIPFEGWHFYTSMDGISRRLGNG